MEVGTAVAVALELAERGVRISRQSLDRLQVQVHAWRLAVDPQTPRWIAETRQGLADGSLAQEALDRSALLAMVKTARSSRA